MNDKRLLASWMVNRSSSKHSRARLNRFLIERLSLEREIAQNESTLSLIEQFLNEAQALESAIVNKSQLKLLRSENLKKMLETSKKQIAKANEQVKENQTKMIKLEDSTEKYRLRLWTNE